MDTSSSTYPTSVLAAAQHTFMLLAAEPTSLYLHGGDYGRDLPAGPILLPRLRDLLLAPATCLDTRDAVWRDLIGRARTDRATWVVVAVGMAMPGPRRIVRQLRPGFTGAASYTWPSVGCTEEPKPSRRRPAIPMRAAGAAAHRCG